MVTCQEHWSRKPALIETSNFNRDFHGSRKRGRIRGCGRNLRSDSGPPILNTHTATTPTYVITPSRSLG
jgi:hypothetical protein